MNNRWFYLAVATVLVAAWMMRWDIYTQHRNEGFGRVYLVDRLTGTVWSLYGQDMIKTKEYKE